MTAHGGGLVYKYVEHSTPETDDTECYPPNSRLCVIARTTEEQLFSVFQQYGTIHYIKILQHAEGGSKPISFVKYALASEAEAAIEGVHGLKGVIGDDHLAAKVFLAETRADKGKTRMAEQSAAHPEDLPPRSRLFVALAPGGMEQDIRNSFALFPGFQNVRMVPGKSIAFVKFALASQAAKCMEDVALAAPSGVLRVTLAVTKKGGYTGMEEERGVCPPPAALHQGTQPPASRAAPTFDNGYPISASSYGHPPSKRLYASYGRAALISEADVEFLFGKYPGFEYLVFKTDLGTDISKGYSFVQFRTVEEATAALAADGQRLNGHPVSVMFCKASGDSRNPSTRQAYPNIPLPSFGRSAPTGRGATGFGPPVQSTSYSPPMAAAPPATSFGGINDDIPRLPPAGSDPDIPACSRVFWTKGRTDITEDNMISVFRRFEGLQYVQTLPKGGCGYAKYDNAGSAGKAVDGLNGNTIGGVLWKVVIAQPTATGGGSRKRSRSKFESSGY